jgi:hypothetical protein
MPFLIAGLALATLNLADAAAPPANPLAPAESGMVQCYGPDRQARSCQSMSAYRHNRDGTWVNTVTILPDPGQPLTMVLQTPAVVRDGQVCETVNRDQVMGATLNYFEHPVPVDHALPLLSAIADSLAGLLDHEVCTTYIPATGGVIAHARMAGSTAPIPDQAVIWVRPDAGYRVSPASQARAQG